MDELTERLLEADGPARAPGAATGGGRPRARGLPRDPQPRGVRHRQRDPRAAPRAAAGPDRPARRLSGALRRADPGRDRATGRCRATHPDVATYAILLQCTGAALWFDPAGPLTVEEVADAYVELVLGSLQAAPELIAEAVEATPMRVKPPALPEKATIAVVAPSSPPQTRSETEQATAYFEARGHSVVFGPQPPQGPRLPGGDRRRAGRGPPVGAVGAGHRHGPHALRRLRRRPPSRSGRLGRGRRSADRLRLQRHHRAPPGSRQARGLGQLLRAELPAFHAHARTSSPRSTEDWFHRAFQPEPLGRVFEDPDDPYVLTVGEGWARVRWSAAA